MKDRLRVCAVVLAILTFSHPMRAQTKVGVININAAIAASAEGKKAMADLQRKYQPRQQELERLQGEIQSIQDKLSKQPAELTEQEQEEQRRLSRDLDDKQRQLKRSTEDAQTESAADRDEAVRRILQKMVKIIAEYAQQNGYSLIVDSAQIPVYYVAQNVDITADIVKRYDAANPVADAGAPAKPATPATRPTAPPTGAKPK